MAFFKFRKAADESASAPVPPQSVEAIRQRAKYRLVGASVLVLLGVIGFPLLFDKQPRPIAVDIPIDIPDRNKVGQLTLPGAPAVAPQAVEPPVTAPVPDKSVQVAPPADAPGVITETAEENRPPEPVKSAKARALPEGKTVAAPAAKEGRFVVQVGAFADAARAHEVRLKLERAGLKTYTHVAETKDGKRIRVRVGPFAARAEAEKSAEKIKKLNLPAALLTL